MLKTEIMPWNGFSIHIAKPDFFTSKIRLMNNNFLFNNYARVFQEIGLHQPGLVLDVGANYGVASLEFFHKHIGDQYVMFEPISENCQCIEETFKNTDIKYTLLNCGISDHQGTANFDFKKTMSGTSGISDDGSGNRTIDINTIDQYQFENVKFIKIDTEGHELEAITGAEETIKKYRPVIFYECTPKNDHQVQKLEKLFSLLDLWDYCTINSSFHLIQTMNEVELSNQVSNSLIHSVKDLVAIPKELAKNLTLQTINRDACYREMRQKLGKNTVNIHNVDFVLCTEKDTVHQKDPKTFVHINQNMFKTSKHGMKIFTKYQDKIYWSYEFFLHNQAQLPSFFEYI